MARVFILFGAALAAVAALPATASVISIDKFGTAQGPISDFTVGGGGVSAPQVMYLHGGNLFSRDLSIELLARVAPIQDAAQVSRDVLDVNNGVGEKTRVDVTYALPASLQTQVDSYSDVSGLGLLFTIVGIDLSNVFFTATLNGVDLGTPTPIPSQPGLNRFSFSTRPVSGTLVFTINGQAGYDVTIDDIALFLDDGRGLDAPTPASLALFGFGVAGVAIARRRR